MTSPLIDASALHSLLTSGTAPVLLDVRYQVGLDSGHSDYLAGHLPGAVYVDLEESLASAPGSGGRHPLPSVAVFIDAMRAAGVSNSRPVVVYDDWAGRAAGRAWWLLRYHGHDDVRVLDGGLAAWVASGLPLSESVVTPEPGDFTPGAPLERIVDATGAVGAEVLIDARAPERYRGEVEPIDPVAGHIPGAVNVPTTDNLTPDGRFRTAAELRSTYVEVGAVPGRDIVAYCGSGVTACHDIMAMRAAGIDAALYPGSWSGWLAQDS